MAKNWNEPVQQFDNVYHMDVERVGNMTATTLYKNGKIILYEETVKEIGRASCRERV